MITEPLPGTSDGQCPLAQQMGGVRISPLNTLFHTVLKRLCEVGTTSHMKPLRHTESSWNHSIVPTIGRRVRVPVQFTWHQECYWTNTDRPKQGTGHQEPQRPEVHCSKPTRVWRRIEALSDLMSYLLQLHGQQGTLRLIVNQQKEELANNSTMIWTSVIW